MKEKEFFLEKIWNNSKKVWICSAVVFVFVMVLSFTTSASPVAGVGTGIAFLLLMGIRPIVSDELWKNRAFQVISTVLIIGLSAVFNEKLVQYLILEPLNHGKMIGKAEFYNVICCVIPILAVLVISANVRVSAIVAHVLLMILAFANYFVYQFRGNELTYGDVKAVKTGLSVATSYQFHLQARAVYTIFLMILYIALMMRMRKRLQVRWAYRLAAVAVIAVSISRLAVNTSNMTTETWEQKGSYRNGFILNFGLGIRDTFISAPEGYSLDVIQQLEEKYASTEPQSEEEDPTIIVIMNESFADLGVIGDLQTTEEVTPFFNSLSENTTKGYAISSVYSAKTPNSEWEFLTGNSMAFLPTGSVPYQQYLDGDTSSIVTTMKQRGYKCLAMHPYYSTGWSRNKVYPWMGFDEMLFIDKFDNSKIMREYITDEEMYSKIMYQFKQKDPGEKLFIMGVTMQNHGGYTDSYMGFTNTVQMTNGYYTDVNQYLTLMNESDKALEQLITYFQGVDEKVEIVFFGDHQPGLNSQFYEQLNGRGLAGLTTQQLEDLFTVPFFVWTNYESESEQVEITSLNYLSLYMMEKAGIELNSYQKFLADLREVVPAMNSRAYYSKSAGTYLHYNVAAGRPEEQLLKEYEMLQYNCLFEENPSEVFFPCWNKKQTE